MKKLILLILLFVSINASSQNLGADNKQIDTNARYCQIVGTSKPFTRKLSIDIDYGQQRKWFKNTTKLVDSTGQAIIFNSMIDALNFMAKNKWEFVTAYTVTVGSSQVYHYLLRRTEE